MRFPLPIKTAISSLSHKRAIEEEKALLLNWESYCVETETYWPQPPAPKCFLTAHFGEALGDLQYSHFRTPRE